MHAVCANGLMETYADWMTTELPTEFRANVTEREKHRWGAGRSLSSFMASGPSSWQLNLAILPR